jgi:branched-chain amino acid transport system permease protein
MPAFAGIGAYACALAPVHLGVPHPALVAVLLGGAMISAAFAFLVGRPILRLKGYYLAVATLGFGILVSMVLSTTNAELTARARRHRGSRAGPARLLKAIGINLVQHGQFWYFFCGIVLILGAWLALNLRMTAPPAGRCGRCTDSEVAARTVGVDVARVQAAGLRDLGRLCLGRGLACWRCRTSSSRRTSRASCIRSRWSPWRCWAASIRCFGAILGAAILTLLPQVLTVFAEYEQLVLGLDHDAGDDLHARRAAALDRLRMRRSGGGANADACCRSKAWASSFGGLKAVNDVSFTVKPGEIVSVIGPNGAGKTTLFNMISGVYRPGPGVSMLNGEDVTACAPHLLARRGMSRTFQNLQIFQSMSVLENAVSGYHLQESVAARSGRSASTCRPRAAVRRAAGGRRVALLATASAWPRRRTGGGEPLLWRAQAAGDRPRAGVEAQGPAAGRTRRRLQRRRDRGDRPSDRRGRGLGRRDPAGRARHEDGDAHFQPYRGARPRREDRRRASRPAVSRNPPSSPPIWVHRGRRPKMLTG